MRCPVCRAELTSGPTCRRCRADLSLLFTLDDQRQELLRRAAAYLARGDGEKTAALADEAAAVQNEPEALRLRAAGSLLARHFPRAWDGYRAWRKRARPGGAEPGHLL
jgi:hypothetical protein